MSDKAKAMRTPRGGGRYSIYPCVGRCGPVPHTLTLFKTKIADVPTLFKTEFRFLIPCLRHLTRNHTLCKTIVNKKNCCSLVRRTYAQAVHRPRKDNLFKTKIDKIDTLIKRKNDKIDTLFKTKNPQKHILAGRTSPFSPYKGVPPPPTFLGLHCTG